jgi:hypothetical protein
MKKLTVLLFILCSIAGHSQPLLLPSFDFSSTPESIVYRYDLAKIGTYKSNSHFNISDNTFDGKGVNHVMQDVKIIFYGTGTRNLVFKNFHGAGKSDPFTIEFDNATINNSSGAVTIKLAGNDWYIKLDGKGNSTLNGLKVNGQSQTIYSTGDRNKGLEVCGFTIYGGRNTLPGNTTGGPGFQVEGSHTATCNASNWNNEYTYLHDMSFYNICDEPVYIGYNNTRPVNGYVPARMGVVKVRNIRGYNFGRDGIQIISADSAIVDNVTLSNGGLEGELNHVSGFSMNGGNKYVSISNCNIRNFPQFIYSGTEGVEGYTYIDKNYYDQETAKAGNQACYLKADVNPKYMYTFRGNTVICPNVLRSAIAIDRARFEYNENSIVAKKEFYTFNDPILFELPVIKTRFEELTVIETSREGKTTTQYFLNDGTELTIKQP